MDHAEQKARSIVNQFRPLFQPDVEHMADGLVMVIAGELRAAFKQAHAAALRAAEEAVRSINRIQQLPE